MNKKIAFTSLGCDKNRVDSEVMLGILQKNGYTAVADEAEADIIVVNTCSFIKDALEESIETILEMAQYKDRLCPGTLSSLEYPPFHFPVPKRIYVRKETIYETY